MSFAPLSRIGPYEIQALLGTGGMGEVYRARDTRLQRLVALKVLRADRGINVEHQSRFLQEARAASGLQHPHIISVFDFLFEGGTAILVLEYLDGKTLDQVIPAKGMRLNEALRYAIPISDALAAAHAAGIVHRDLKPSNVMSTGQDVVKLLDFGLAKLTEAPLVSDSEETQALFTERRLRTQEGIVLGTVSYMSPEQAEGRQVDARSDIFSFGCLLYEMTTGRRPFGGDSHISTLSAILRDEPKSPCSWRDDVPRDLEKIILRCLRKDPNRRWQNMLDVRIALEELKEESDSGKLAFFASPHVLRPRRKRPGWWIGAVVGLCLLAAIGAWILASRGKSPAAALISVPLTGSPGLELYPSFSPDGNQVAFAWNGPQQDNFDIYVKLIGAGEPLRLTTDSAADYSPAWSPDGREIAFLRQVSRTTLAVMVVPALGGTERKLIEIAPGLNLSMAVGWGSPLARAAGTTPNRGLAWSPDGQWLVVGVAAVPGGADSLVAFSVLTGERRKLTSPPGYAAVGDLNPAFSPDGRRLAFSRGDAIELSDLYLLPLSADLHPSGEAKRITFDRRLTDQPVWEADGRSLVFVSNRAATRALWRMAADGRGSPEALPLASERVATPAMARQGNRFAYVRLLQDANIWQLNVPVGGQVAVPPMEVIASTLLDRNPQLSRDGSKVAFQSDRSGTLEIWVARSDGSHQVQVTHFGRGHSGTPRWSPDGTQLVFDSNVEGPYFDVYIVNAEGGTARRLTMGPSDNHFPSWSHDGQWIYFGSARTGRNEIWKQRPGGGSAQQITKNGGRVAFESPDGEWLYYRKEFMSGPVWRMPLGGGEEAVAVPGPVREFAFGASGVYYMLQRESGSEIDFLAFRGGVPRLLASLGKRPDQGLTVSPDEKRILYSQIDQESGNITLVENFR